MRPQGPTPGRPGVSAIRLRQIDVMTAEEMALLRRLRTGSDGSALKLFGRAFEEGPTRGYRHEMDAHDLADFLASVRQGKQSSDLLIAMVHAHETGRGGYPEPPSAFLKDLACAAIDAGADVVSVSGIHHVGPVDLYRGRPVFYGLGNFIWSDVQEYLPAELFDLNRDLLAKALEHPERATAADLNAVINADYFAHQEVFETVLPIIRFDGSELLDVTLHPVDLGYGDRLTSSGIPRLAGPDQAARILHRIREASASYGCENEMEIESGVGKLRCRA
jgi:poly-gamma-glutamate synthesis protein (capsule biosynthesis protein)